MSVNAPIPAPPPDAVQVQRDEAYLVSLLRGLAHNRGVSVSWAEPLLELLKRLKRQAVAGEQAVAQMAELQAEVARVLAHRNKLRAQVKSLTAEAKRAIAQAQEECQRAQRAERKAVIKAASLEAKLATARQRVRELHAEKLARGVPVPARNTRADTPRPRSKKP